VKKNLLNDLSGPDWLRLTKSWWSPSEKWLGVLDPLNSWWETEYPIDPTHKVRSYIGCAKPPAVGRDLSLMFTKKGQWVLDTHAGTGGLILGASLAKRNAIAVTLNPQHAETIEKIGEEFSVADLSGHVHVPRKVKKDGKTVTEVRRVETWEPTFAPVGGGRPIKIDVEEGDCMDVLDDLDDDSIDFVMADPPYGVGHKVSFKDESEKMASMPSDGKADFGSLKTTKKFLGAMDEWGDEVFRVLKPDKYAAVFMGDRYMDSELVPLGFLVARTLQKVGFLLKGMIVWRNKSTQRRLKPYAVGTAYVPNIIHQYIIVLRKEV
jgi:DNA modification methylase